MMHRLLDSGFNPDPKTSEQFKFLSFVKPWERLASVALIDFKRALIVCPELKDSPSYKQTVKRFKALANFNVDKIEVGDNDKLAAEIDKYMQWKVVLAERIDAAAKTENLQGSKEAYQTCLKLLGFGALFSNSSSKTKILLAGVARNLINPIRIGANRAKRETDLCIAVALAMHSSMPAASRQEIDRKVAGVIKSYSELAKLLT